MPPRSPRRRLSQIREIYSKYTVGLELGELRAAALIRAKYVDGRSVDIHAEGMSVPDLLEALLAPTEVLREKEDAVEMEKN